MVSLQSLYGAAALAVLIAGLPRSGSAAEAAQCGAVSETCLASCSRFNARDARLAACTSFCRKQVLPCSTPILRAAPDPVPATQVTPPSQPRQNSATEIVRIEQPAIVSEDASTSEAESHTDANADAPVDAPVVAPDVSQSAPPDPADANELQAAGAAESQSTASVEHTAESNTAVSNTDSSTLAANANILPESQQHEAPQSEPTLSSEPLNSAAIATALPSTEDAPSQPTIEPAAPFAPSLSSKGKVLKELEKNAAMVAAIRSGDLKAIRRLIEVQGLSPTFVYAYDYNPLTKQFDSRIVRLRLIDVFNDANTLRKDAAGLDRILAQFLDLGMDVNATMTSAPSDSPSAVAQTARTAWGPTLRMMEGARDREARVRALELALQRGLVPNDDFSTWLFAELPQVCGRDKSKFAIEMFELLLKYLGPTVSESLWRMGERGPETVADVLDLSFSPAQVRYEADKARFAEQDLIWENCAPLSRRINRLLTAGN
jgi:hypothetical protein